MYQSIQMYLSVLINWSIFMDWSVLWFIYLSGVSRSLQSAIINTLLDRESELFIPEGEWWFYCRFHFFENDCYGWVLWHINHCRLFNAKSSLYIYIKYIGFGLVGFYGISTIVGYLMPNPLYTYILNIYDLVWLGLMAYQPL